MPFPFYCDTQNLIRRFRVIFYFAYELHTYACTHHPERLVHGRELFTYTLKSTVRIVSVLSVICRQIVVSPFCYVLSSCPLDALAIWLIYIIVCYESCTYEPGLVLFVFARLALYVPPLSNLSYSERPSILHERWPYCAPLAWTTLLRSFLLYRSFFYHILLYIYIRYEHEINNSTSVHVRFLFYRRIGKYC